MKVLKPGVDRQFICTGAGNKVKGCGALLEVARDDLRWFERQEFPWRIVPEAVLFRCPCCGAITDIPRADWPSNYTALTRFSSAWRDGSLATQEEGTST